MDMTDILIGLKENYQNKRAAEWVGSPFEFLVPKYTIKNIGCLGEEAVAQYCAVHNVPYRHSIDTEYDCTIYDIPVEIKFTTRSNDHRYTINQIRDQRYAYILVIGVYSGGIEYWLIPKTEAALYSHGQHGGATATETRSMVIKKNKRNRWCDKYYHTSMETVVATLRRHNENTD